MNFHLSAFNEDHEIEGQCLQGSCCAPVKKTNKQIAQALHLSGSEQS